jgi:NitT/TauT family transport system permease protein
VSASSRVTGVAAGTLVVAALWYLLAALLRTPVVPFPHDVARVFPGLVRGGLLLHAAASFGRTLAALALSFLVALPVGVLLGRVAALDRLLSPAVYLLTPVPKIALLPIVLLLFGLNDAARVLLVFLVLFFQMLVAIRDAVRSVEPRYLLSARSLGAHGMGTFRAVLWPSLLPALLSVLRVGSGTALAVLFFAETFATRWGLGYLVTERWMRVAYAEMYAAIVTLGLEGLLIFSLADWAERRFCRWTRIGERR